MYVLNKKKLFLQQAQRVFITELHQILKEYLNLFILSKKKKKKEETAEFMY